MSKMTIQEKLRGLADGKRYRDSAGNKYLLEDGRFPACIDRYSGCNYIIDDEWQTEWTEIKELDWSADEHDPEVIEDLWPVECWDSDSYKRTLRFFNKKNKQTIEIRGARNGVIYHHYRAIPRDQWTKWQEEKYNELKERYYVE